MYTKFILPVLVCLLLSSNSFGLEANQVQTPSHTSGIPMIPTNFATPCAIMHPICPQSFQPCPADCPDACYVNSTNSCCPMEGTVYCPNETYPPTSDATSTTSTGAQATGTSTGTSTVTDTANSTSSSSLPSSSIVSTNATSVSTSAPSQSGSNSSTSVQPSGTNANTAAISGRTSLGALAVVVFGALMLI